MPAIIKVIYVGLMAKRRVSRSNGRADSYAAYAYRRATWLFPCERTRLAMPLSFVFLPLTRCSSSIVDDGMGGSRVARVGYEV